MSDKDLIYDAIISILDKELKKLHISMPSGISEHIEKKVKPQIDACLLYTSPSPRDRQKSRMPSSA